MNFLKPKCCGWFSIPIILLLSGCGPPPEPQPGGDVSSAPSSSDPEVAEYNALMESHPGRWREMPESKVMDARFQEMVEELEAIGYAQGSVEAGALSGVALHKSDKALQGYNLYTTGHTPLAILMDMEGEVLHTWAYDYQAAFGIAPRHENDYYFRRAYPLPGGDLIAIFEGTGLIRLNKMGELVWALRNGAHHDLDFDEDGVVHVLTRTVHVRESVNPTWPMTEDFIATVTPGGEEIDRFSLIDAFTGSPFEDVWQETLAQYDFGSTIIDSMHTNTLNILDGEHGDVHPGFRRGNYLIASLQMSALFTVNPETRKVAWAWHGRWEGVHEPTLLENGDILFYINRAIQVDGMEYSKVIQANPLTHEARWEFGGRDPLTTLLSPFCGTVARLPNGNTLITASEGGRAVEVSQDNEIVWDFYSPHRTGSENQFVGTLFHVERLPLDTPLDWIEP